MSAFAAGLDATAARMLLQSSAGAASSTGGNGGGSSAAAAAAAAGGGASSAAASAGDASAAAAAASSAGIAERLPSKRLAPRKSSFQLLNLFRREDALADARHPRCSEGFQVVPVSELVVVKPAVYLSNSVYVVRAPPPLPPRFAWNGSRACRSPDLL